MGTALRAGAPLVVVPTRGGQFFWGRRVHDLGVGLQPVPFGELNRERLAGAPEHVETNIAGQYRVEDLGKILRAGQRVSSVMQEIERVFQKRHGRHHHPLGKSE